MMIHQIVSMKLLRREPATVNKSVSQKGKKRPHPDITDSINAINRIADVISKDETPVRLPEPPKLDQVGGFLIGIGHQLRQLPDDIQLQTVIEILQLIKEKK
ncbi:GSCOCG00012094001-RA-CDS [Cotesia congregata]|nr:GSCOCG00012094001-RA-CDS [Cotesia congregata]